MNSHSVGGTYILKDDASCDELGWSDSGGGFSFEYSRPSYQDKAVTSYISSTTLPSESYFNKNGRGYPDISALSTNYNILVTGEEFPISGTSASTPVAAGMIALINHERLSKGQPSLGFLNPLLYSLYDQNPSAFNDVTVGNNKVSGCSAGFSAAKG
jgi:subtilase family serine protease